MSRAVDGVPASDDGGEWWALILLLSGIAGWVFIGAGAIYGPAVLIGGVALVLLSTIGFGAWAAREFRDEGSSFLRALGRGVRDGFRMLLNLMP